MAIYRTVCPFCKTHLYGATRDGRFVLFSQAVIAVKNHWRFVCGSVPKMRRKESDVIADGAVEVVEE